MNNAANTATNISTLKIGDKITITGKRPSVVDHVDTTAHGLQVILKGSRGGLTLVQGFNDTKRVRVIKGWGSMNPQTFWARSSDFVCEVAA